MKKSSKPRPSEETEAEREEEEARSRPGSAIDTANQDQSGADHSPARQKDRAREEPHNPGTDRSQPDEDTYD